jgi:hypothetical protein
MSADNTRTLSAIWQTLMLAQGEYGDTPEKWHGIGCDLIHVATCALESCLPAAKEMEQETHAPTKPRTADTLLLVPDKPGIMEAGNQESQASPPVVP